MDAQAPAVVAVVVTRDPGPWLEECLGALARQDYPELSVLVLVAGGSEDPTARVAHVFPDAFVRRLGEVGFGAAANEAIGMVEGASFFLFCHDDIAPRRDAVTMMVEESLRSNAGVVTPKFVRWDDPRILLHVGMSADKTGAMVERLSEGEIDHGQHDNVRDVFVAPEGCTLVRADLFVELRGYDPVIAAMAADLDLSWRAQVAGSRVVVCPEAVVRHLEAVAGGVRPALAADGSVLPSDQALLRRHELRTVLKCYGTFHLLRVLPQIVALGLAEMAVALAARHRPRARAVWDAWRWNLARRAELRQARRLVQHSRQVHDSAIRRQQRSGSARLAAYLSNVAHLGVDVTHRQMSALAGTVAVEAEAPAPELTGSVGGAFSEDADFDELDDLGRRSRRPARPRILASRRSRLTAMIMVAILLALGSRNLLGGRLPLVGQFVPLLSWSGTWHQFFSGWQPAGVGTTAPASGAFAALGVIGTVLLGGMGLVQKVLVLGCLPLGAWGVSRLVRPLVSRRASLVAAIAYLGLPLGYDALAGARIDGLVAFAASPWLLARLARAGGLGPFGAAATDRSGRRARRLQLLSLGVLLALSMAFAPAMVIVVLLCALGLGCTVIGAGERGSARRLLGAAAQAIVVALVLSAPWVVGTAFAGSRVLAVLGLPTSTHAALSWASLVRFHVGPVGGSPLSWLLLVAALFPLLVGTGPRLAWAARLWSVAVLSWGLALVVERGWSGSFAPSLDVLLAPAAVAVAACVGLGVSAFETDLAGHRFGWRQGATAVMVAAVAVGVVPVVAEVGNGRWGVAPNGFEIPLSYLNAGAKQEGGYRVLWLGDPRTLPLGGFSAGPGLAYATSEDGLPTARDLFAPASPGPAAGLAAALALARGDDTVHLGRLLAPAAVRYVVVLDGVSPSIPGVQSAPADPPPPGLIGALDAQVDLRQIPGGEGFTVYVNAAALPERAERGPGHPALPSRATTPSLGDLAHWRGILPGPPGALAVTGPVAGGTVFSAAAPAGHFQLLVDGRPAAWRPAFGWASQYRVAAGTAELRFRGNPIVPVAVLAQFVLWLVVAWLLADARFGIRRRVRRRRGVERRHPARRARSGRGGRGGVPPVRRPAVSGPVRP